MLPKVLIVDNDVASLHYIREVLHGHCDVQSMTMGSAAWNLLKSNAGKKPSLRIDAILLGHMLADMSGKAMVIKIKSYAALSGIPIIMQTTTTDKVEIDEGIRAGVYYYLTKPYEAETLLAVVLAAIQNYHGHQLLPVPENRERHVLSMIERCEFSVHKMHEIHEVTLAISQFFPDPARVTLGLTELLVNAIEHGNLGISYEDKSRLHHQNRWDAEITRRELLPQNEHKVVYVRYEKTANEIIVTIRDEGNGFNWKNYLEFDPARATDPNGRGIALSKMMSFDELEYNEKGNEVRGKIKRKSGYGVGSVRRQA